MHVQWKVEHQSAFEGAEEEKAEQVNAIAKSRTNERQQNQDRAHTHTHTHTYISPTNT